MIIDIFDVAKDEFTAVQAILHVKIGIREMRIAVPMINSHQLAILKANFAMTVISVTIGEVTRNVDQPLWLGDLWILNVGKL